jgi:hypothetical protein
LSVAKLARRNHAGENHVVDHQDMGGRSIDGSSSCAQITLE